MSDPSEKKPSLYTLEVIKTACAMITALGVIFAVLGFYLQKRVWEDYHQRARADKAIALFSDLNKSMKPTTRAAIKLVEGLGSNQLKCLYEGLPFQIPATDEPLLKAALPEDLRKDHVVSQGAAYLDVTSGQSFALRWQVVEFLNNIEFICQAWKRDVADQVTIEAELAGLYNPAQGQTFCASYRDRFNGRTHYPALYDFLSKLRPTNPTFETIGGRPRSDDK